MPNLLNLTTNASGIAACVLALALLLIPMRSGAEPKAERLVKRKGT